MPDMLAHPDDLAAVLGLGSSLDLARAIVLIEAATAIVQAACDQPPQRLLYVEDDEVELFGDMRGWLMLPQRPVQNVTAVSIDDGDPLAAGTDYKVFGSRLWLASGWWAGTGVPATVNVTYSHGYPAGDQGLQLARAAVLGLIRGVYGNPNGATAVRIDDYSASYDKLAAQMDASEHLQVALRRQYGRPAGMVRLG